MPVVGIAQYLETGATSRTGNHIAAAGFVRNGDDGAASGALLHGDALFGMANDVIKSARTRHLDKMPRQRAIKLRIDIVFNCQQCRLRAELAAIRTRRSHRIKGIHQTYYARHQRQSIALQPLRIAGAVGRFVMHQHRFAHQMG